MSQNHRIKSVITDVVFQEQCFLWERDASVGAEFDLFNIKDLYVHAEEHKWNTWDNKNKKKYNRSPLKHLISKQNTHSSPW